MKYRNEDLTNNGYLNAIAQRWGRRIAGQLRKNKDKGPWVGKGAATYATKLQTKMAELMGAAATAVDDPEAMCAAAAELATLSYMFCDVVVDETAVPRETKRKAAVLAAREKDKADRAAKVAKHLTDSRAAAAAAAAKQKEAE